MTQVVDEKSHAAWIAERIDALLDRYAAPPLGSAGTMARDDWVAGLLRYSRDAIERACSGYLEEQPDRVPMLSDIARRAAARSNGTRGKPRGAGAVEIGGGDRARLSPDQRRILEEEVLPTARRWLQVPGLAEHGRQTLSYWGETF